MAVKHIDSFLVHPAKGLDNVDQPLGTRLPHSGELFEMLRGLFERAPKDCRIDIIFRPANNGQENPCRTLLLEYLQTPTLKRAHQLAIRLAAATSGKSGLGLLFVISGKDGNSYRVVIARFPADQGVLAEEKEEQLTIEFVEKIFMKSAKSYKCAVYSGSSLKNGFWRGKAIDKQINGAREISEYWIGDFLESVLATTPSAGTRRLGDAIRRAVRDASSDETRAKLVAAAQLIPGRGGQKVSPRSLLHSLAVPADGITAVEAALGREELMDERFQLDSEVFAHAARYKLVELDNGAVLMAETPRFDDVFHAENVSDDRVRYTTEGRIVDEKLRRKK